MVLGDNDTTEKEVTAILMAWDEDQGTLTQDARQFMVRIQQALNARLATDSKDRLAREMQGCMDRLDSFLLQVSRLAAHADPTRWSVGPESGDITHFPAQLPPKSGMVFSAKDACTDFESLLFHGRAVLDRLTLFVSREYGENSSRFSKFRSTLVHRAQDDERAVNALAIIDKCQSIEGVLADIAVDKSLRSIVAHRDSISAGTTVVFMIWRLVDGRFLAFDSEAHGYPIINTAATLAVDIPFLVLNTICLYGAVDSTVARRRFGGIWNRCLIVYSQYVTSEDTGLQVPSVKTIPDGVRLTMNCLKADVVQHVLSLEDFPSSRGED